MKKIKSIKKLEIVKLKKDNLYHAKGGGSCSCGTTSQCHIDGLVEGADQSK